MFDNDRPRSLQPLSGPLNSEPLHPLRRVFDADDRLVVSTPCVRCGYDLHHQKRDGTCPECNLEVTQSIFGLAIRAADPDYYRAVLRGVRLMSWSLLMFSVSFLGCCCLLGPSRPTFDSLLFALPLLVCAVCFAVAVFSVSRRSAIEDERDRQMKGTAIPAILTFFLPGLLIVPAFVVYFPNSASGDEIGRLACASAVPAALSATGMLRCIWVFCTLLESYLARWGGDSAIQVAVGTISMRNGTVLWFLLAPTIAAVSGQFVATTGAKGSSAVAAIVALFIIVPWTLIGWWAIVQWLSQVRLVLRPTIPRV